MKKGLVYVCLTSIIMIPIISIIVVEILNQNNITYTSYDLSYNYDDLETDIISIEDIEETIFCNGIFSGDIIDNYSCSFTEYSSLICNVEVGSYIKKNDSIFIVNGEDYCSENSGVVSKVNVSENAISVDVVRNSVTNIIVPLDVSMYPNVDESSIFFTYGGKNYQYNCTDKKGIASDDPTLFEAYYDVSDGNDFIFGGEIELSVKTGNVHKDAYTVPKKCIFKEGNTYYIEKLDSNGITKLNVTLGLVGEQNVEIFPGQGVNIKSGEVVVANNVDVFSVSINASGEEGVQVE